jgi:hypothetical protein
MTFLPSPVQRPRIPIWVVGAWPAERSMARAARWDGLVPQPLSTGDRRQPWGPAELAQAVAWVRDHRPTELAGQPYAITSEGTTPADDPAAAAAIVRPWAEAGATWWIEADWSSGATLDAQRRRIEAGPPVPR